jgi:hypothetical protein
MRKPLTRGVPVDSTLTEIEKRHNQLSKYGTTPDIKQLQDVEVFAIDDGTTVSIGMRLGGKIYKVDLTEV